MVGDTRSRVVRCCFVTEWFETFAHFKRVSPILFNRLIGVESRDEKEQTSICDERDVQDQNH